MFPLTLYARARNLPLPLRTGPRVQRAPGIPYALSFEGEPVKPRAHRAARLTKAWDNNQSRFTRRLRRRCGMNQTASRSRQRRCPASEARRTESRSCQTVWARKSTADPVAGSRASGRRSRKLFPQAFAVRVQSRDARHRRRDRGGDIHSHRAGGGDQCGAGGDAVVLARRRGLRLRRAVLRRNGLQRSDQRKRLYLRLCHARRVDRMDHRLGSHPRIRGRRGRGGGRMVRLCRQFRRGFRHRTAAAAGVRALCL